MPQYQTFLRCSQTTAALLFIIIGTFFVLTGCTQFYKTIGMTDEQAADQVAQDQVIKKQILGDLRLTTTGIITTTIAGLGAIASGFLAKWLGTERKISKALITGIESANSTPVKQAVTTKALAAGVEKKLHARVKALT